MVQPVIFRYVNCLVDLHILVLVPGRNIMLVHAQARSASAINQSEFAVIITMTLVMNVLGQGIER
jgi:hypothetical protein